MSAKIMYLKPFNYDKYRKIKKNKKLLIEGCYVIVSISDQCSTVHNG